MRASNRNNNHPDNRNNNIGFRVLCLSHIDVCFVCRKCQPVTACWPRPERMDGAGESRPHVRRCHDLPRRAYIEAGRRLDTFSRRPPLLMPFIDAVNGRTA
ncbi:hypothetical protein [Nitrosomonas marina]|uniref:hypothetical protein n=1 Tax=Nitrosomonas marina TaxID=917 RepID=UPI00210A2918